MGKDGEEEDGRGGEGKEGRREEDGKGIIEEGKEERIGGRGDKIGRNGRREYNNSICMYNI